MFVSGSRNPLTAVKELTSPEAMRSLSSLPQALLTVSMGHKDKIIDLEEFIVRNEMERVDEYEMDARTRVEQDNH